MASVLPDPEGADITRLALIERGDLWRVAAHALGEARSGYGSVLSIEGPSGMGKTALLAAIRTLAEQSGMQVLSSAGRRRERDFRFGVIVQLVEEALWGDREQGHSPLAEAARLYAPAAEAGEPPFEKLHGLYHLCAAVARSAPLAIVVDDADLADDASLRCLLYLVERVDKMPVAIVITRGRVARSRAPELLDEVTHHKNAKRCTLERLTPRGTQRRLAKRWPSAAADAVADDVCSVSGGNPFLVDELAGALADLDDAPTGRFVRRTAPPSVADWALSRACEVDPRAPQLVAAAATLGQRSELRHIAAVADLDPASAAEMADTLREIGLFESTDMVSFTEPVVGRAVDRAQAPGERGERHLHAARLLAAEDADPERVGRHLLKTTRTGSPWVVDCLCIAAAIASGRAAPYAAVRYLRRALDEPPSRAKRAHIVLELGRAEATAGEPQAAGRLSAAVKVGGDVFDQARDALDTGRTLIALGRPNDALAAFDTALAEVSDADSDLAGRLRVAHATARWLTGLADSSPLGPEPPPTEPKTASDRALLAVHAMSKAIRGEPHTEVRELAERALDRGALLEDETADGLNYYLASGALAFADELSSAEASLTAAVQEAESRGSVLGFATASHVRAATILMRGRLNDAVTDATHALAVENHGWRLGLGGARVVLAQVLIEKGDLDGAAVHLDAAEADQGPADPFALALLLSRGRRKLFLGDADGAFEHFEACGEIADSLGVKNPAVAPWRADAGLARAVMGDWAEGRRLVESELSLAREFGAPGPIGRALRALASMSEPAAALEALEAAVSVFENSQAALERATTMVDFGAALRRAGRRRDALRHLPEGLELAELCGAEALVRRAMREVNAAGARPRRAAMRGTAALTAREHQVAVLAAEGLSNREIADTLVVTIKTVEWHLRHTFEKLGVKSRRELDGILGVSDEQESEPGEELAAG